MSRVLIALLVFAQATFMAHATPLYFVTEQEAKGGLAERFFEKVEFLRRHGIKAVLPSDECVSACTFFLNLMSSGLVCARPNTVLVFHQAVRVTVRSVDANGNVTSYWTDPVTEEVARRIWFSYPQVVRHVMPSGLPPRGNEFKISAQKLGVPLCE